MFNKIGKCLIVLLIVIFCLGVLQVFAEEKLPDPGVVKDRPLKISFVSMSLGPESMQRNYLQSKIEAAARGWEWSESTGHDTAVVQREAFATVIETKPDAIVVVYMNLPSFNDLIIEARKQGIGVYCIDSGIVDGVVADATQPNAIAGVTVLYWGINYLGKKGAMAFTNCEEPQAWMVWERVIPARALIDEDFTFIENLGTYNYAIASYLEQSFTTGTTLADKYGDKLDWVFACCDPNGVPVAKGLMTAGMKREQAIVTGIDGGTEAFNMIREGTPFIATYAQPFEKYAHDLELIDQIQVKGIFPGDKGSSIQNYGEIIYESGMMITPSNVPAIGTSVYETFNYWGEDPDDSDAWVNWYKKIDIKPYAF